MGAAIVLDVSSQALGPGSRRGVLTELGLRVHVDAGRGVKCVEAVLVAWTDTVRGPGVGLVVGVCTVQSGGECES